MGAESFCHEVKAKNPSIAFNTLFEDAREMYGRRSYNGTITTCSAGRCRKSFPKYSEANKKKAYKFIESIDYGEKWVADYIDLGICCYRVKTVKKKASTYSAKFKQKFAIVDFDGKIVNKRESGRYGSTKAMIFDKKSDADKATMKMLLNDENLCVAVQKTMVRISGKEEVSSFTVDVKDYKSKPKLKAMPNRTIEEIHEYIFYGLASC